MEDRQPLLECLRAATDEVELASLLYIWGYWFSEEPEVRTICQKHIQNPNPGVTSVCLKLVCDFWGHWREHERDLASYLDPAKFDVWYDEVIVAYSFVSRHPHGWSRDTLERFARLDEEGDRLGLDRFG